MRPHLLNFSTAPEARGRGYAKVLVERALAECRARRAGVVTLHASKFGRPVYETFGFAQTNEMMLRLK